MSEDISIYLSGNKLYGDDFNQEDIDKWFESEAEGYANLGASDEGEYCYAYHALNRRHGFLHMSENMVGEALGVGSAYGEEFRPIAEKLTSITILDPSDAFEHINNIAGTPCTYVRPCPSGNLPFDRDRFNLITSLGVMHHIPNVTHVIGECYRCLRTGGAMLLREPITSMGDWRMPRSGLTRNERGIPLDLLDTIVKTAGFNVRRRSLCVFPLIPKLSNSVGLKAYNSYLLTLIDWYLSKALSWNNSYHREAFLRKMAPSSVYYVLEKSE